MADDPKVIINKHFEEFKSNLDRLDQEQVSKVVQLFETKRLQGKTIFFLGNGGSAATASHAVCDLSKTVLGKNPQTSKVVRFKTLSLTDNVPLFTAIGNDLSFDEVFAEQLKNYAQPGDVLVIITGSGNSVNLIRALETADQLDMETVGFLGFDGGKAKSMVNHVIMVDSHDYGVVEDTHMLLVHAITRYFRDSFEKNGS